MHGFSLRALSEATGSVVSHAALAKYESGVMHPGSEVLIALSKALNQSIDYFYRPFELEMSEVRFRKKTRLGVSAQKAILEKARDYFERYHEAEELADDVKRFKSPFAGKVIKDASTAESMADELRKAWRLGGDPLPNVQELMESHGIKVFEAEVEGTDFDGLSAETSVGPVVVLSRHLNSNLPRKRMTSTHELAHVVAEFEEGIDERVEEDFAKRFAGAFLLPQETFIPAFGKSRQKLSLGELIDLKARFGASIFAIMKRAEQLALISPSTFKQFCIFANTQHWRSNGEPGDDQYKGIEGDGRFRQLVLRAVAEEQISSSRGAALLGIPLTQFRREIQEVLG